MNKNQQTDNHATQQIEREYIDSMLGIDCRDDLSHNLQHTPVDYKKAYENDNITCSVFNISGLSIAAPDSCIRQVLMQQALLKNAMNNSQSTLHAGKIEYDNETIEVFDIEYLLLNGVASVENTNDDKNALKNIVLIKGCSAGFICNDQLSNQIISNEHIHWRDSSSKRIWLAGTIAQMGLALLDIEGLITLAHSPG